MGDLRDISLRNAEGIARLKAGDPIAARDIWIDALMQLEELFVISTTDDDEDNANLSDSDDSRSDRFDCDMDDISCIGDEDEGEVASSLDLSSEDDDDDDNEEDETTSSEIHVSVGLSSRITPSPVVDITSQEAAIYSDRDLIEPCKREKRRRVESNASVAESQAVSSGGNDPPSQKLAHQDTQIISTPILTLHRDQPLTSPPCAVSVSSSGTFMQSTQSIRPVCVPQRDGPELHQSSQLQEQNAASMISSPVSCGASGVYVGQSAASIYNRTWQLPSDGPYELQHLSAAVLFNLALVHHRAALYATTVVDQASSLYEAVRWYQKAYDFLRDDTLMVAWVLYLRAALVFNLMHIYSTLGDLSTLFSLCQELQGIRMMLSTLSTSSSLHGQWTNPTTTLTPDANVSSPCWNTPTLTNEDEPDIDFLQKSMLSLNVLGSAVVSR